LDGGDSVGSDVSLDVGDSVDLVVVGVAINSLVGLSDVGFIKVEGDVDGLSDRLMDGTFVLSGEIVIFTVG
jgi:uncharacterized membrane protein (Fun14 family)